MTRLGFRPRGMCRSIEPARKSGNQSNKFIEYVSTLYIIFVLAIFYCTDAIAIALSFAEIEKLSKIQIMFI